MVFAGFIGLRAAGTFPNIANLPAFPSQAIAMPPAGVRFFRAPQGRAVSPLPSIHILPLPMLLSPIRPPVWPAHAPFLYAHNTPDTTHRTPPYSL